MFYNYFSNFLVFAADMHWLADVTAGEGSTSKDGKLPISPLWPFSIQQNILDVVTFQEMDATLLNLYYNL